MTLEENTQELDHGDPAPAFDLPGTDGDTHDIADFAHNDALLVVFTCNHCPYAQAKFDALNDLAAEYDDAAVVGINPNDDEEYPEDSFERMEELVAEGTIRYDAYLRDESQAVARAYDAACTPDPFLFANESAGEGIGTADETDEAAFHLVYHGRLDDAHGPDETPSEEPGFEMRAAIDAVLAGKSVEFEEQPSRGCSIKWK